MAIRKCLICGDPCQGTNRFCSSECAEKGRRVLELNMVNRISTRRQMYGFTYYCVVCGKKIENPKRTAYCSEKCSRESLNNRTQKKFQKIKKKLSSSAKYGTYGIEATRKCHDCGMPTTNYRCDTCLFKWQKKHHILDDDAQSDIITYNYNL